MSTKVSRIQQKAQQHEFPKSLSIVQKFFPQVTSVEDGKKGIAIEVTKGDSNSAKVRNHESCAMAVACKRALKADGVIVSLKTVYVVQGKDAYRYKIPESVAREIVSFDRNAGFAPGVYRLTTMPESKKLGTPKPSGPHSDNGTTNGKFRHFTSGIRTVLGSTET